MAGSQPDDGSDRPLNRSLQRMVELARANLAAATGLAEDEVEVVAAELVTWRDGSLGCPQPGMMYTQALAPGVLIRLATGGRVYEYHGSRKGPPFLCDPVPPGAGPIPTADV